VELSGLFKFTKIEKVVKEYDRNEIKSGLRLFNFAFVKFIIGVFFYIYYWYLLKDTMRNIFDQFYSYDCLVKNFLFYFVVLISKASKKNFNNFSILIK
jgi:hypothetical protein